MVLPIYPQYVPTILGVFLFPISYLCHRYGNKEDEKGHERFQGAQEELAGDVRLYRRHHDVPGQPCHVAT